jgi:2-dehydro-3-deoxygluconokinase
LSAEVPRPAVVAIGEPLVAFLGQQLNVPLVEVSGYGVHVTGAELNTAVGLTRLAQPTAFVGRVGADPFGLLVRRRLAMEGVDTRWLADDAHPTGMLFRNLRTTAAAEVLYARAGSAGSCLTRDDLAPALAALPEDGIVLTTGVTAAVCPEVTEGLVELARDAKRRLFLDLNYRSRLWSKSQAAPALRALSAGAYLVAGSLEEAELVTGQADAGAAARTLLTAGAGNVVLRHDLVAASWFTADARDPVTVRARARPATDAIGAGDAFMAGLISGIIEFGTAERDACLRRAHHCGVAVVDTIGDLEGALYRHELQALEAGAASCEPHR